MYALPKVEEIDETEIPEKVDPKPVEPEPTEEEIKYELDQYYINQLKLITNSDNAYINQGAPLERFSAQIKKITTFGVATVKFNRDVYEARVRQNAQPPELAPVHYQVLKADKSHQ